MRLYRSHMYHFMRFFSPKELRCTQRGTYHFHVAPGPDYFSFRASSLASLGCKMCWFALQRGDTAASVAESIARFISSVHEEPGSVEHGASSHPRFYFSSLFFRDRLLTCNGRASARVVGLIEFSVSFFGGAVQLFHAVLCCQQDGMVVYCYGSRIALARDGFCGCCRRAVCHMHTYSTYCYCCAPLKRSDKDRNPAYYTTRGCRLDRDRTLR
jgi:hypothetical protein